MVQRFGRRLGALVAAGVRSGVTISACVSPPDAVNVRRAAVSGDVGSTIVRRGFGYATSTTAWLAGIALLVLLSVGCRGGEQKSSDPIGTSTAALCSTDGGGSDAGGDAGSHSVNGGIAASPVIGSFGVYATESILLNANSTISDCTVGVEKTTGPFLSGGVAAYFNADSSILDERDVVRRQRLPERWLDAFAPSTRVP